MATTTRVLDANVNGTVYTTNANGALEALDTCHSGATAPTDELANGKFWLDTTTTPGILKIYNNAVWEVVVNATNVTTAGALMDSELTSITSVKALNQGVATTDSPSFSGLKATGETASRGVSGVAASWINMNGQGTIAIRDSMNVASITDVGVGHQKSNYTSAMSSANYSIGLAANNNAGVNFEMTITLADGAIATSSVAWFTSIDSGASVYDNEHVFSQSFGDLT